MRSKNVRSRGYKRNKIGHKHCMPTLDNVAWAIDLDNAHNEICGDEVVSGSLVTVSV